MQASSAASRVTTLVMLVLMASISMLLKPVITPSCDECGFVATDK